MRERIDRLGKCARQYGKKVRALHRTKIGDIDVKNIKIRRMEIFESERSRKVAKIKK